jgi:hypothetical protein
MVCSRPFDIVIQGKQMASGIWIVDEVESERSKVGVWHTDEAGMITVVNLGAFPSKTTQLAGLAEDPEVLARMLFSEFG